MKYCGGFSFFAAYCGSFEIAAHCTSLNDLIWMKQNIFVCFESDFFVCVYTSHSTFVLQEKKTALILLYGRWLFGGVVGMS